MGTAASSTTETVEVFEMLATYERLGAQVALKVAAVEASGDNHAVLAYGRSRYTVSHTRFRSVAARDGGCRFPGCTDPSGSATPTTSANGATAGGLTTTCENRPKVHASTGGRQGRDSFVAPTPPTPNSQTHSSHENLLYVFKRKPVQRDAFEAPT